MNRCAFEYHIFPLDMTCAHDCRLNVKLEKRFFEPFPCKDLITNVQGLDFVHLQRAYTCIHIYV